jgi:phospholipase C
MRLSKSFPPPLVISGTFAALTLLIACSGRGSVPLDSLQGSLDQRLRPATVTEHARSQIKTPIKHVFIIIQEGRSFDNLFNGYPGANTVQSGAAVQVNASGSPIPGAPPTTVPLRPIGLAATCNLPHQAKQFFLDQNGGKGDGFSLEDGSCNNGMGPGSYPEYAYVPQSDTQPYWAMANQYVLADNMVASNLDGSFVAHQYLIAGWANHAVDNQMGPSWGCDNPNEVSTLTKSRKFGAPESACFQYKTLATELDKAHDDWRYYAVSRNVNGPDGYIWSAFDASNAVRNGPEWTTGSNPKVLNPPEQVLSDIAAGKVPNGVVWIAPWPQMSDDAAFGASEGPDWVAAIVNAIGANTKVWDSSAIFVVWSDWGGWFDHVPPRALDYDGSGYRVPMLVVSAYAKQNYVTHVPYEFGSILKFVEANFSLDAVTPSTCCYGHEGSDRRATNPAPDVFNFGGTPRPFVVIPR